MLQRRLVAAGPDAAGCESASAATLATAILAGWLHDTGSLRLARRWHMFQRRLVAARLDSAGRQSESASSSSAPGVAGWLHDTGSLRLARRWHMRQRRLVATRTAAAHSVDCDQVSKMSQEWR